MKKEDGEKESKRGKEVVKERKRLEGKGRKEEKVGERKKERDRVIESQKVRETESIKEEKMRDKERAQTFRITGASSVDILFILTERKIWRDGVHMGIEH